MEIRKDTKGRNLIDLRDEADLSAVRFAAMTQGGDYIVSGPVGLLISMFGLVSNLVEGLMETGADYRVITSLAAVNARSEAMLKIAEAFWSQSEGKTPVRYTHAGHLDLAHLPPPPAAS